MFFLSFAFFLQKYVTELKMHHGNIGQKLFDATKSLGDAMDLCINMSRRSTCGSACSSTLSVMSDDEGDNHQAVRLVRSCGGKGKRTKVNI
jgi:hypothetical protein